jgi:hypothetical protein
MAMVREANASDLKNFLKRFSTFAVACLPNNVPCITIKYLMRCTGRIIGEIIDACWSECAKFN